MTLANLYPRLTSFASLQAAARRAQRGKRYRPAVLAFNANLEAELLRLQEELRSFIYSPGPYRQFPIRDPKPRLISAAPFRDRVVHHALCAAIVPPLERGFHRGSFANRRGYGSHRALRRFTAAAARHRWVLQADIRLYFPSIDLTILRAQLEAAIGCPGTLWLLDQILTNGASPGPALDAFPGDSLLTPLERPRGLPIGNLTSQFLANLHLNALDHTLSALPGVRAYLRYVGFVVRPGRLRVRNHNLRRGCRRLKLQHKAVLAGTLPATVARTSLLSWNAHLAHGHTWRLRRRLFFSLPYAADLP
jgi:retron-type reverse transcriptase